MDATHFLLEILLDRAASFKETESVHTLDQSHLLLDGDDNLANSGVRVNGDVKDPAMCEIYNGEEISQTVHRQHRLGT
jgi:hypothetical protein